MKLLSASPNIASPKGSAQVTEGYFGDVVATPVIGLSVTYARLGQQQQLKVGTMESSLRPKAGTCATDAATNVPTSPTISKAILTVFFMGSPLLFFRHEVSQKGSPEADGNYKALVNPARQESSLLSTSYQNNPHSETHPTVHNPSEYMKHRRRLKVIAC